MGYKNKKHCFLKFLNPVKKFLYNYIRKSMNYSELSDDIYQETVLRAFKYFDSYDKKKCFKNWIFTIATNQLKNHLNSKNNLINHKNNVENIPFNSKEKNYKVRKIYNIAKNFKDEYRQIFFLYYYNDFKINEISRIVNKSESNIKFILYKLRKIIKKNMEV